MKCESLWDYAGYRAGLLAGKNREWAEKGVLDHGNSSGACQGAGGCADLGSEMHPPARGKPLLGPGSFQQCSPPPALTLRNG